MDTGRLRRVIELVAREAGWGRKLPKGQGLGIAGHYSFVSYVAAVVEAAVDSKGVVTIPRIDIAVDCGATVNPDRVRAQMEGAAIMGIGVTLGEISYKAGRVEQNNFDTYQVARMNETPRVIRVHIVPGGDYSMPMGGVGSRRAAGPARAVQRDLRGHRQEDPPAADPGAAESGSPRPAGEVWAGARWAWLQPAGLSLKRYGRESEGLHEAWADTDGGEVVFIRGQMDAPLFRPTAATVPSMSRN